MTETKQDLEEEVARLRVKVADLEHELETETKKRKKSSKTSDSKSTRNISKRATDEGGSLVRGMVLAGVETVRVAGSVLSSFADTVSQRNSPEEKDSKDDLTRDLPKDIYSGVVNAVERTLDIPEKVIDKLQEGYKETKEES